MVATAHKNAFITELMIKVVWDGTIIKGVDSGTCRGGDSRVNLGGGDVRQGMGVVR